MSGTVRHRLISPTRLPYGPVSIRLTPTGDMEILLDETEIDPLLAAAMNDIGATALDGFRRLDTPTLIPEAVTRIHAVSDVGGGRLVAMEIEPGVVHGFIDKELARPGLLRAYGEHCTAMLRRFALPAL
jgi:hypothetical protein